MGLWPGLGNSFEDNFPSLYFRALLTGTYICASLYESFFFPPETRGWQRMTSKCIEKHVSFHAMVLTAIKTFAQHEDFRHVDWYCFYVSVVSVRYAFQFIFGIGVACDKNVKFVLFMAYCVTYWVRVCIFAIRFLWNCLWMWLSAFVLDTKVRFTAAGVDCEQEVEYGCKPSRSSNWSDWFMVWIRQSLSSPVRPKPCCLRTVHEETFWLCGVHYRFH